MLHGDLGHQVPDQADYLPADRHRLSGLQCANAVPGQADRLPGNGYGLSGNAFADQVPHRRHQMPAAHARHGVHSDHERDDRDADRGCLRPDPRHARHRLIGSRHVGVRNVELVTSPSGAYVEVTDPEK